MRVQFSELKKEESKRKQIENVWIPAIDNYFAPTTQSNEGDGISNFLQFFARTPKGQEALQKLVRGGHVDIDGNIDISYDEAIITKWRNKVQKLFDAHGTDLWRGVDITQASFRAQIDILREPRQEAIERAAQRDRPTISIPLKLLRSKILPKSIVAAVEDSGGPWKVSSWRDRVFVDNILRPFLEDRPDNDALSSLSDAERKTELTAAKWINKRLGTHAMIGSYMIFLYVRHHELEKPDDWKDDVLQWLRDREQAIEGWAHTKTERKRLWKKLIVDSQTDDPNLWQDLSVRNAAFLAKTLYKHHIKSRARRGFKTIDGIPIPALPSFPSVVKTLQARAIGVWKSTPGSFPEPVARCDPAQVANRMLEHKCFPIGHPIWSYHDQVFIEKTEDAYAGRWIPLQLVLLYLLCLAVKNDLLILPRDESAIVEIDFGLWADGTTCIAHSILALLAFLVWKPNCSNKGKARWARILRLYPVALAVLPETIQTVTALLREVRKELPDISTPFNWRGRTWSFKFKIFNGDNSVQQKAIGNSVGGDLRCSFCDADFSFPSIWSFKHLCGCFKKTLSSVLRVHAQEGKNLNLGEQRHRCVAYSIFGHFTLFHAVFLVPCPPHLPLSFVFYTYVHTFQISPGLQ